jgi:hypothetical protein
MSSKRVADPVERALDAYDALDAPQQEIFHAVLRVARRYPSRYIGTTAETAPLATPKRGRPAGSKNKKLALAEPASPLSPEGFDATALFSQNGAVTEDL